MLNVYHEYKTKFNNLVGHKQVCLNCKLVINLNISNNCKCRRFVLLDIFARCVFNYFDRFSIIFPI